jgi:hypothetical protein
LNLASNNTLAVNHQSCTKLSKVGTRLEIT